LGRERSYILTRDECDSSEMQKRIDLQEHTYLRLVAVLDELAHHKTRDMTFDDVINDLIDIYQENSWTHFGAGAGGG
jgi:DNA-directed RNA polymerase delta subunit